MPRCEDTVGLLTGLPPALQEHIDVLRRRGYIVEIIHGEEIGIVIRNYPIPSTIWRESTANLLIKTHPTYPNATIDMFWLDPPISLRRGTPINGVTMEIQFGCTWQRFSWHVGSWNPAHDNLLTYLNVVDDRLSRNE